VSLDWTTLTDGELATLSIAGREAAFAEIMRRHRPSIFRILRACVGEADEALDLLQETFVAAHQALPRYDGDRSMRAWLSTIAINKCRDWGRKRTVRRFLAFAAPIGPEAEAIADDQVAIDDATIFQIRGSGCVLPHAGMALSFTPCLMIQNCWAGVRS